MVIQLVHWVVVRRWLRRQWHGPFRWRKFAESFAVRLAHKSGTVELVEEEEKRPDGWPLTERDFDEDESGPWPTTEFRGIQRNADACLAIETTPRPKAPLTQAPLNGEE